MRRLAAVDWLLIGTLLPICCVGVVMSVVHGNHGDFGRPPFLLSSAPDEQSYPIVRRVLSSSSVESASVAVGDRVMRLGTNDLRGVSYAGFILRWSTAAQTEHILPFTIERDGVRSEIHVPLVAGSRWPGAPWWAALPFILGSASTALLLLMRAAQRRLARSAYMTNLLFAIASTPYFAAPAAPRFGIVVGLLVVPLAYGVSLWTLFEFTAATPPPGPWLRALPWVLGLLASASAAAAAWLPDAGFGAILMRAFGFVEVGFLIAILVALTRVYRVSDALGRRQIKWLVYGFYVGTLPYVAFMTTFSSGLLSEWIRPFYVAAMFALVALPLGMLVAIVFYQFLDIDRLFSATLAYSVLAILGMAMVFGVMPTAARAMSGALGLGATSGQLVFSFCLAAVFVPGYRIVRPWIDRLLFSERAALDAGFERLLSEVSNCTDMRELTSLVGERLDKLLRPTAAVLYARAGDVFTPMTVRGRTAPPAFTAQSALIAALQERTTPLAAERWGEWRRPALGPFDRAALETLDVAVFVPIRRGSDLVAFSCLGPKRSGDIYTLTDLALLGAVADRLSAHLLSLSANSVAEQARAVVGAPHRDEQRIANDCGEQTEEMQPEVHEATFRREGEYWSISWEGAVCRLRDTKGIHYIAHLLRHPGVQLHVRELLAVVGDGPQASYRVSDTPDMSVSGFGDAGPMLDPKAKADYKRRLADLRGELEEAEDFNDPGRVTRAREEIDLISNQLAAAVGLSGRDRSAASDAERARLAVTKRIKAALAKIRDANPALALHLGAAITTGYFCSYSPKTDTPTSWVFG